MLELDRLSKRFGSHQVLRQLDLTVEPGQMYGFCGSNGAGKTTAMRLVLGLLRADQGVVRWHGRPIDDQSRRRIGYLPEERGLYPRMRPYDQLVYLARIHGRSLAGARRGADYWLERLAVVMRPGDSLDQLSLGNQQKVQLAAALMGEPELLILDEPFSGLDPLAVDVLVEVLREQCRAGVPVVLSSHQLDLVERLCDRVGILAGGRLAVDLPVARLHQDRSTPVALAELFREAVTT